MVAFYSILVTTGGKDCDSIASQSLNSAKGGKNNDNDFDNIINNFHNKCPNNRENYGEYRRKI